MGMEGHGLEQAGVLWVRTEVPWRGSVENLITHLPAMPTFDARQSVNFKKSESEVQCSWWLGSTSAPHAQGQRRAVSPAHLTSS